ncbi:MAG: hypothetical protein KGH61_05420 [Candidatus Micrarchaeota archaeon]|nr:hypothetical protein [Candidatus Micrarchaeota archaeon]MDE1848353.1 hypothetical protein [Candidatus Micrarchaeota archaeon]MDE1864797.1 hypothetical protein [Candidatus Micrarchaeota archaeon]
MKSAIRIKQFNIERNKVQNGTDQKGEEKIFLKIVKAGVSEIDKPHKLSDLRKVASEVVKFLENRDNIKNGRGVKINIEVKNGTRHEIYTIENTHAELPRQSEIVLKMTTVITAEKDPNFDLSEDLKTTKKLFKEDAKLLSEQLRNANTE